MGCITDYNIAISQIKTQQILNFVLPTVKKKPFKRARDGASVQLLRHDAYCPIKLSN